MHEKFVATKTKRESLVIVIRSFNTFMAATTLVKAVVIMLSSNKIKISICFFISYPQFFSVHDKKYFFMRLSYFFLKPTK